MDLHRKSLQNRRQNRIAGEPKPKCEEVLKYNNFISFGSWDLFIRRGAHITNRKESGCLIFLNQI
jgi:hypothetical protein